MAPSKYALALVFYCMPAQSIAVQRQRATFSSPPILKNDSQQVVPEFIADADAAESVTADPAHPVSEFKTPQDLMTCSGEPIKTTTCMTFDKYDEIVDSVTRIMELDLEQACDHQACQHADWAGCVLRMTGHDFMDHHPGGGGSDACTDMYEADNAGLPECLSEGEFGVSLNSIYPKFCQEVSLADFLVITAQAVMSILATHGEPKEFLSHNLKHSFSFGRTTLTGEDCKAVTHHSGRHLLPNPAGGCGEVDRVFVQNMGLDWREATALMGVHSLGRASLSNSGYVGYWDTPEHSRTFNNHYYVTLLATGWCPELNVNGCEGADCTPKHQWKRCDTGTDKFKHREMMLNTDMCLAYVDAKGGSLIAGEADSNCCAWTHTFVGTSTKPGYFPMEDVVKNNNNSFCNVPCGETFVDWKSKKTLTMNCFNKGDGLPEVRGCCEFEERRKDCQTPGLGDHLDPGVDKAPAIEFVRQFAANEMEWVHTFVVAWKKATENGFSSLKLLADSCAATPPVTPTITKVDNGFCFRQDKDYGSHTNDVGSAEGCKAVCEAKSDCKYFSVNIQDGKCRTSHACDKIVGPLSGYVTYQLD